MFVRHLLRLLANDGGNIDCCNTLHVISQLSRVQGLVFLLISAYIFQSRSCKVFLKLFVVFGVTSGPLFVPNLVLAVIWETNKKLMRNTDLQELASGEDWERGGL